MFLAGRAKAYRCVRAVVRLRSVHARAAKVAERECIFMGLAALFLQLGNRAVLGSFFACPSMLLLPSHAPSPRQIVTLGPHLMIRS
jgi:hypothetical protein